MHSTETAPERVQRAIDVALLKVAFERSSKRRRAYLGLAEFYQSIWDGSDLGLLESIGQAETETLVGE